MEMTSHTLNLKWFKRWTQHHGQYAMLLLYNVQLVCKHQALDIVVHSLSLHYEPTYKARNLGGGKFVVSLLISHKVYALRYSLNEHG